MFNLVANIVSLTVQLGLRLIPEDRFTPGGSRNRRCNGRSVLFRESQTNTCAIERFQSRAVAPKIHIYPQFTHVQSFYFKVDITLISKPIQETQEPMKIWLTME